MQTAVNGSARRRIGPAKNASQRQPRAGAPLLCILFRREKGVVMDVVYVSHFWHLSESESESVGLGDSEVPVWGRSGELVGVRRRPAWGRGVLYGDF